MHPCLHFQSIDSTNRYVKDNYASLENGTVVVAEHQTAGRGRLGRTWLDDGTSLMFSLLLKGKEIEQDPAMLSLLAGAAMSSAIESLGIATQIKWPNDILIDGKKVAGILLEGVSQQTLEAVIIGIGVNVNSLGFDPSIQSKATSLRLASSKTIDKQHLLENFLAEFDRLSGDKEKYMSIVCSHSYLDGKTVYLSYYGENKVAKAVAITSDGKLLLEEEGRRYTVGSGEVTLEKTYCPPVQ